jgi:hypothetical protein
MAVTKREKEFNENPDHELTTWQIKLLKEEKIFTELEG